MCLASYIFLHFLVMVIQFIRYAISDTVVGEGRWNQMITRVFQTYHSHTEVGVRCFQVCKHIVVPFFFFCHRNVDRKIKLPIVFIRYNFSVSSDFFFFQFSRRSLSRYFSCWASFFFKYVSRFSFACQTLRKKLIYKNKNKNNKLSCSLHNKHRKKYFVLRNNLNIYWIF